MGFDWEWIFGDNVDLDRAYNDSINNSRPYRGDPVYDPEDYEPDLDDDLDEDDPDPCEDAMDDCGSEEADRSLPDPPNGGFIPRKKVTNTEKRPNGS